MANTAFEHSPTLQVPGSTTTNGLVTWDANDGGGFLSSSVVLSTGGALSTLTSLVVDTITIDGTSITTTASNNPINLTPHGTGAVVITKTSTPTILLTNSTNAYAITLNTGTTAANYTITLPAALPGAAGKVLQSSGGSPHSVLEWATPSGGAFTATSGGADTYLTRYSDADAAVGSNKLTFTDASADFNINLSSANPYFRVTSYSTTDSHEPYIELRKSGHATIGSNAAVADAEPLGTIAWAGSTTSGWSHGAKIYVKTNAPFDGSQEDARMYFAVKNSTSWVDVMTVADNTSGTVGVVGIGTTTPAAKLDVAGGDVKITGGNVVIGTAGKGIDFSAQTGTASPGTAVDEILDHYEQGTFTPTFTGPSGNSSGVTYSSSNTAGHYQRIGDRVFINFRVTLTSRGSVTGGASYIGGLPFANHSGGGNDAGGHLVYMGNASLATAATISLFMEPSNAHLELYSNSGTSNFAQINVTNWTNSTAFIGVAQYRI